MSILETIVLFLALVVFVDFVVLSIPHKCGSQEDSSLQRERERERALEHSSVEKTWLSSGIGLDGAGAMVRD